LAQQLRDKAGRSHGKLDMVADDTEQVLVVSGKPDAATLNLQKLRQQTEYRCGALSMIWWLILS
jgi:hypothetical protein